jgi:hypothetical protein
MDEKKITAALIEALEAVVSCASDHGELDTLYRRPVAVPWDAIRKCNGALLAYRAASV